MASVTDVVKMRPSESQMSDSYLIAEMTVLRALRVQMLLRCARGAGQDRDRDPQDGTGIILQIGIALIRAVAGNGALHLTRTVTNGDEWGAFLKSFKCNFYGALMCKLRHGKLWL